MKNKKFLFAVIFSFITFLQLIGQTPESFSYQAVIRDSTNKLLVNQQVGALIEMVQGSISGESVYTESHITSTNQNGLISLSIGEGVTIQGEFSNINWSEGPYFLKTQTDPSGGENYTLIGNTQLLSVPYAMHAKTTDAWKVAGDTISTLKQLTIGSSIYNQSAILELTTQNQGFLPPRLNNNQRDSIEKPTDGMVIYNTKTKCLNFFNFDRWFEVCGNLIRGKISNLDCSTAIIPETIPFGFNISANLVVQIPYSDGNGGSYNSSSITSSGVLGLTASLDADSLSVGDGFINILITGFSISEGVATFELILGGKSCSLNLVVEQFIPSPLTYCLEAPTEIVEVLNPITGRTWMDRNLGASRAALSSDDSLAIGDLYQWGRRSDGHQCRTSNTTVTLSSSDIPDHGDFILNPNQNPFDWRITPNSELWQGADTVSNPCPSGYRLPTAAEMNAEISSWNEQNVVGAYSSPLEWTTGGIRQNFDGAIGENANGAYWTSTANTLTSRGLTIGSNSAQVSQRVRGSGLSVRCIKD